MSTTVKMTVNSEGFPMHTHPLGSTDQTRWHWAWEKHPADPQAHEREDAAHPAGWRDLTADQKTLYKKGMAGTSFKAAAMAARAARPKKARTVTPVAAPVAPALPTGEELEALYLELEAMPIPS